MTILAFLSLILTAYVILLYAQMKYHQYKPWQKCMRKQRKQNVLPKELLSAISTEELSNHEHRCIWKYWVKVISDFQTCQLASTTGL